MTAEYTIQQLTRMAGVSARTLRYYDEIGLLKPARVSSSRYRIYSSQEIEKLQQILLYRELGVELDTIRQILDSPNFDALTALKEHLKRLQEKQVQLNTLIQNVEKTIASEEGRVTMQDKEKFEGFKRNLVQQNEELYGDEIRAQYGDKAVDESNQRLLEMSPKTFEGMATLEDRIRSTLQTAVQSGDPAGETAQRLAHLHHQWLIHYWSDYSKEAHARLAQMYVDDDRFRKHYDDIVPGGAVFLRDAIAVYTGVAAS
ncbi:MerR family transcriptional regulator [Alicyclobacillus ferrooxydans]|uniref:MerR family transcriptional regulator n=1 Tax=Alicyclobacillus ferrooxydans TaxID=471514 RepID=A0A0P9CHN7_9BACL|nr:MerR family transcriptional regulator [Alicyclobacillus ferrooxydans]KPV44999.1 MerR family transcriptional regulator [Alicyclobacillus ferrooxydans]